MAQPRHGKWATGGTGGQWKPAERAGNLPQDDGGLGAAYGALQDIVTDGLRLPDRKVRRIAKKMAKALRRLQDITVAPPDGTVDPSLHCERLIDMSAASPEGFTRAMPGGEWAGPGHCVALPGVFFFLQDLHEADLTPSESATKLLASRLDALKPLIDSGLCWFGGWKRGDKKYELNLTMLFAHDRFAEACDAARAWDQKSLYTIEPDGAGSVVDAGGTGGRSLFD